MRRRTTVSSPEELALRRPKATASDGFVKAFARRCVNIFFSHIEVVGAENLPDNGPVLVVGNHNNQFVDPMVIVSKAKRPISFLVAEKSMHRRIVGDFAKMAHAVPVIRPQDRAKQGAGHLCFAEDGVLKGVGTNFTKDLAQVGCLVKIKGAKDGVIITEVLSDTEASYKSHVNNESFEDTLRSSTNRRSKRAESKEVVVGSEVGTEEEASARISFKVLPKINQADVFASVVDALGENRAIGIFPEGGSTDRTELLPLKAGVSVIAMLAAARGIPVKIVPFGINYFNGHAFRSRVVVDVGLPLSVPASDLELFNSGDKRSAYASLLSRIEDQLRSVTLNAPNFQTLTVMRTMRRMYQNDVKLSLKKYMILNRRFNLVYSKFEGDNQFISLVSDVRAYSKLIRAHGVTDSGVMHLPKLGTFGVFVSGLLETIGAALLLLMVATVALPGILMNFPIYLRKEYIVKKHMAKALANSTVKEKALDVAASQKIMLYIMWAPSFAMLYSGVAAILIWQLVLPDPKNDFERYLPLIVFFGSFLVFFPLYAWLVVRLSDKAQQKYKEFPKYRLMMSSFFSSSAIGYELRSSRKKLMLRVQDMFEEKIIPEFPEWQNNRIITRGEVVDARRPSDLADDAAVVAARAE